MSAIDKVVKNKVKIFGKLVASIETDDYSINKHVDECLQKIEDTWSDVSVDYSSVEEYFLELVDVDSWYDKGLFKVSLELV